jgi:hypothetical protein
MDTQWLQFDVARFLPNKFFHDALRDYRLGRTSATLVSLAVQFRSSKLKRVSQ